MNNCLTCCNMTFPNNCSFLKLSDGRLRLHLSKLLCRPFCIKFSSGELYVVVCDARGKDSDRGGNTSLCVCAFLCHLEHRVSVLPWQHLYDLSTQHLVEPCADSTNGTGLQELLGCRNSWAQQLL